MSESDKAPDTAPDVAPGVAPDEVSSVAPSLVLGATPSLVVGALPGEAADAAPEAAPAPAAPDKVLAAAPSPSSGRQSAGAMLRQMREEAGIDLARVASAMKVSPQKLEALESDRFDELPNITFARGLASAICRAFGVNPAPVLERMPVVVPDLRVPDNQFSQHFQRSGDLPAPLMSKNLVIPLLIVVAVLLIGAVALKLLPIPQIRLPEAAAPASAPSAAPDGMAADENAGPAPVEAAASAESAASTDAAASAASIGQDEAANEPPAASAGPQETASAPVAAASASDQTAAADDVLAVTTSGDTWITVHDAANKKAPLFSRLVTAGETIHINNGQPPLSVTIGRKDVAQVTVRGQPFDLKSLGASSVAHFTVK